MRAWDQPTEMHMKHIEDRFQAIVRLILHDKVNSIAASQKRHIDSMFALWYMRTRYRRLDAQEVQLGGMEGNELTLAEEESLEKNGYLFARGRKNAGPSTQRRAVAQAYGRLCARPCRRRQMGRHSRAEWEFIVPDIPVHTIIPLSPRLALVAPAPDGTILEANVAEINTTIRAGCLEYYFARDLSMSPFAG